MFQSTVQLSEEEKFGRLSQLDPATVSKVSVLKLISFHSLLDSFVVTLFV